jgi:hypothetical protein
VDAPICWFVSAFVGYCSWPEAVVAPTETKIASIHAPVVFIAYALIVVPLRCSWTLELPTSTVRRHLCLLVDGSGGRRRPGRSDDQHMTDVHTGKWQPLTAFYWTAFVPHKITRRHRAGVFGGGVE